MSEQMRETQAQPTAEAAEDLIDWIGAQIRPNILMKTCLKKFAISSKKMANGI